ncbi:hypothetical protein [Prosthecobacter sp.]|uniref:hypothetical protein n=1 Tax=Prosthecobacter sp. TaxID=1965333 RepID=UPI003783660A
MAPAKLGSGIYMLSRCKANMALLPCGGSGCAEINALCAHELVGMRHQRADAKKPHLS